MPTIAFVAHPGQPGPGGLSHGCEIRALVAHPTLGGSERGAPQRRVRLPVSWRCSMPVVGGGHRDAGGDRPDVGDDDVGGSVPPGDDAADQEHPAPQLPAVAREDMGPEDELHVV